MDAQRLLGSLLGGSMRRSLPSGAGLALGMGAIGVAIAAWEHYSQQRAQSAPGTPAVGDSLPPLPPRSVAPPPMPGVTPTGSAVTGRDPKEAAVLLVRAMVLAAHADGAVDQSERMRILDRVESSGLSADEVAFLARELDAPPGLEELLVAVTSPELAEQVYTASLLAMRVDNNAERAYCTELGRQLALADATIRRLHQLTATPVWW